MSRVKDFLSSKDFNDLLNGLITHQHLEHKAEIGIAKQIISKGIDSLTDKQKDIFKQYIKQYAEKTCCRCNQEIPFYEIIDSLDNGGYCSYCYHQIQKED